MKPHNDLLTRRVEKILPSREGLEKSIFQRKIRLYQGFDPTGTKLHLGHSIGLRKLMEFADAGHEVIFLFGTGTVLVGDPSQRDSARKLITQQEIDENINDWKRQAEKIVDFEKISVKQNGDWLLPLTLKDIVNIASNISAVQLFKREMFQRRIARGDTIWYHETMYPLLQGYDSVAMDVDLEIGGTDQEFNMLVGRELMKKMKGKEKYVLTTPMIFGTDGKQMSKTSGNCIWLTDTAEDMFGKLMSIPDEQIVPYMELVTDIPLTRIGQVKSEIAVGKLHPMDAKKELGIEVVSRFHGKNQAEIAKINFEKTIQQGEAPKDIPNFSLSTLTSGATIVDLLVQSGSVTSKGEARRLIDQKAVSINQSPIINYSGRAGSRSAGQFSISELKSGDIIKIGKRKWLKLVQ
ncbi:tyrosine--tRNA ligase [Candidatus Collierbacteria bacterium]|nr:tyrosine--tRNA ligase [Candidatus Collierbacteria bacterium]